MSSASSPGRAVALGAAGLVAGMGVRFFAGTGAVGAGVIVLGAAAGRGLAGGGVGAGLAHAVSSAAATRGRRDRCMGNARG